MSTADRLVLAQWLSPAFPLGAFAYSHGLETAIAEGTVHDAETALGWIDEVIRFGSGRVDAALLCLARAGKEVDATARALAASAERLEEAEAQGRAFVETVARTHPERAQAGPSAASAGAAPVPLLPVAVGEAARGLALGAEEVAALYLQAFASNLVSCAVRFVPLGQAEGQATLAGLQGAILAAAAEAARDGADALASGTPAGDLHAMRHETLQPRIFRT